MDSSDPQFQLNQADRLVSIKLSSQKPYEKYEGVFTYEKLPIEFRVIFENIEEFYDFLVNHS